MDIPEDVIPLIQEYLGKKHFCASRLVSKAFTQPWQKLHSHVNYEGNNPLPKYILHVRVGNVGDNMIKDSRQLESITIHGESSLTSKVFENMDRMSYFRVMNNENLANDLFHYLPNLKNLHIDRCQFNNNVFIPFKSLETVTIYDCPNITSDCFQYFNRVKTLRFGGNVSDSNIINLSKIKQLFVRYGSVTDKGLAQISEIEKLHIGSNFITDKGIANLTQLTDLNCKNSPVSDHGLKMLTKLKKLSLSHNALFKGTCFESIRKLKSLTMYDCKNFDSVNFRYLSNLTYLAISNCQNINDNDFVHLVKLDGLTMDRCKSVSDKAFEYLTNLTTLVIRHCNQETLTDRAFEKLKRVQFLRIDGCTQLSRNILINLPQLNDINVSREDFDYIL